MRSKPTLLKLTFDILIFKMLEFKDLAGGGETDDNGLMELVL